MSHDEEAATRRNEGSRRNPDTFAPVAPLCLRISLYLPSHSKTHHRSFRYSRTQPSTTIVCLIRMRQINIGKLPHQPPQILLQVRIPIAVPIGVSILGSCGIQPLLTLPGIGHAVAVGVPIIRAMFFGVVFPAADVFLRIGEAGQVGFAANECALAGADFFQNPSVVVVLRGNRAADVGEDVSLGTPPSPLVRRPQTSTMVPQRDALHYDR